jgi:hypothetical protein
VSADGGDAGSSDPTGSLDLATAARRVLDADGRSFVLQAWQIAYCFALVEGREPFVPPGCGVGKGWLDARLREAANAEAPSRDG